MALPWSHVRPRQHATREPLTNDITLRTVTVLWAKPLSVSRGVGGHRMRMKHWWGRGRDETRLVFDSWKYRVTNIESSMNRVSVRNKMLVQQASRRLTFIESMSLSRSLVFYSLFRIFFSKNRSLEEFIIIVRTYIESLKIIYRSTLRICEKGDYTCFW